MSSPFPLLVLNSRYSGFTIARYEDDLEYEDGGRLLFLGAQGTWNSLPSRKFAWATLKEAKAALRAMNIGIQPPLSVGQVQADERQT